MALTSTHSSLRNREQKKRPDDAPQERPVAMDVDERRVSRKRDIPSKTSAPAMALGLFFYGWPLNGQPRDYRDRVIRSRRCRQEQPIADGSRAPGGSRAAPCFSEPWSAPSAASSLTKTLRWSVVA